MRFDIAVLVVDLVMIPCTAASLSYFKIFRRAVQGAVLAKWKGVFLMSESGIFTNAYIHDAPSNGHS